MPASEIRRRFRMVRLWVWWDVWVRDFIVLVAIALSLWSSWQTLKSVNEQKHAAAEQRRETRERINETCHIQEAKQVSDVDALKRTYEYLGDLSPRQLRQPLNRAVLAGLPSAIREAQTNDAPGYCDAPGVGLPEPNPTIPRPPENLP